MSFILINNIKLPEKKSTHPYVSRNNLPRRLAREKGEIFYNREVPCRKGHMGIRYVKNNHCVECEQISKIKHKNNLSPEKKKSLKKKYHLKQTYNLTPEAYEKLLIDQDYKCAICKNKLLLDKQTHIDHCHKSNKIRGILCHHCNLAIGLMKNNSELLRKAALYCEAA